MAFSETFDLAGPAGRLEAVLMLPPHEPVAAAAVCHAAGFEKGMKDAHSAAVALQSVSDEAAFGPALGALGSTCKSCHDKYRLPQQ